MISVSARMLAELAVRAGHDVVAVDRFGDLDLQQLCPSVSVLRDLGGRGGMAALVDAAEGIPAPSAIYGAGLENRPDLVARLASGRRLLGCTGETLERVRDPARLAASLRSAGLAYPSTFGAADAPRLAERSRRWLRKPVRGGGGRGVREWRGGALDGEVIVQEHISGLACSAAAVADGHSAVLLGVSEQLIGHRKPRCARIRLERKPRAAAARRGGAKRAGRSGADGMHASGVGVRTARAVRRGSRVGRRAQPGSSRSTPVRRGRSNASRPRTTSGSSPPTSTVAPGACPRSLPIACRGGPPGRRFCSPPETCASATPAAGLRAASATCRTRMSASPPAIPSARSSRCRSPHRRFSQTSRSVPPRSASSSVTVPGSGRSADGPMLRPEP